MKKILFLVPAILIFANVHARNNPLRQSLKDSLQLAADKLYEQNNRDFLTVEALKDGILQPGEHYFFTFSGDTIQFEGKKLSKFQKEQYQQRFRAFLVKTNGLRSSGSTRSTITFRDVFDTTSTLWSYAHHRIALPSNPQSDSEKHKSDIVILQLLEDKLADTSREIKIVYTSEGITVNGTKLSGTYEQKYKALIIDLYNKDGRPSDFVSILYSAHPKSLRYPHPGIDIHDK